jgi:hypothetical protein
MEASCAKNGSPSHRSPDERCACGVYALKRPAWLSRTAAAGERAGVIGSVAMWGKVVEHRHGYRAEFAYPDRIRLACPSCLGWRLDGAPETVYEEREGRLIPACAAHAPRIPPFGHLRPVAEVEGELLSTYAVELLPLQTLHRAGLRPRPPGLRETHLRVRARLRSARPWRAAWALLAAFFLMRTLGVLGPAVQSPPDAPFAAGLSASAERPEALRDPEPVAEEARFRSETALDRQPVRSPAPDPLPRLAVLCGQEMPGGWVRLRECWNVRADLLGFAWSPPEPWGSCEPDEAYTGKERFSVCWLVASPDESWIDGARVELPGVQWWDLREEFF